MFLRLRSANPEHTLKRLTNTGIDFEGGDVEVEDDGVVLASFTLNTDAALPALESTTIVGVRKHAIQITPNPAIGEALGFQPAFPLVLSVGAYGCIAVTLPATTPVAILERLTKLEWLAKVHIVMVDTPNYD